TEIKIEGGEPRILHGSDAISSRLLRYARNDAKRGCHCEERGDEAISVVGGFGWCGREDSNFHGVSPTATSTLRVYQFRHDRTAEAGVISKSGPPYQAAWTIRWEPGRAGSSGGSARRRLIIAARSRRWKGASPPSVPGRLLS